MSALSSIRIHSVARFLLFFFLLLYLTVTGVLNPVLSSAAAQEPTKPGTAAPPPANPPTTPPANPTPNPPANPQPENPPLPGDCG